MNPVNLMNPVNPLNLVNLRLYATDRSVGLIY